MRVYPQFVAWLVAVCLVACVAKADSLTLYGDASVVPTSDPLHPSAYQAISSGTATNAYGGAYITFTSLLTPATLLNLSADYQMTQGTFGGGAPRFTLFDTGAADSAWIYWGTPLGGGSFSDPNAGSTQFNNTGNYTNLLSSDIRVYSNGFGGLNTPNTGMTWAAFVASPGVANTSINYISLDLDGAFTPAAAQTMLFDNFSVNNENFTPSVSTPLPKSVWGGIALFGGVLFLHRRSRKAAC